MRTKTTYATDLYWAAVNYVVEKQLSEAKVLRRVSPHIVDYSLVVPTISIEKKDIHIVHSRITILLKF